MGEEGASGPTRLVLEAFYTRRSSLKLKKGVVKQNPIITKIVANVCPLPPPLPTKRTRDEWAWSKLSKHVDTTSDNTRDGCVPSAKCPEFQARLVHHLPVLRYARRPGQTWHDLVQRGS